MKARQIINDLKKQIDRMHQSNLELVRTMKRETAEEQIARVNEAGKKMFPERFSEITSK